MLKTTLIIGGIVLVLGGYFVGKYNTLVSKDESVKTAWSQVQNQYQRRLDLVPNLVNTVKGFARHERDTLESVIRARSRANQTNVNISDEQAFNRFQNSQNELSSALSRLMVVVEQYPDIKANQNFLELQAQLEGTENRISVERKNYNDVVKTYNIYIRSFPNNLIGGMFGFEKAVLFLANEGAENVPVVDFE